MNIALDHARHSGLDLPSWITALSSLVALSIAYCVPRSSEKRSLRRRASAVVCYSDNGSVYLYNGSDQPVTGVALATSGKVEQIAPVLPAGQRAKIMDVLTQTIHSSGVESGILTGVDTPEGKVALEISFVDCEGRAWRRDLDDPSSLKGPSWLLGTRDRVTQHLARWGTSS